MLRLRILLADILPICPKPVLLLGIFTLAMSPSSVFDDVPADVFTSVGVRLADKDVYLQFAFISINN